MSISLMFICQNTEPFFQYFLWSIRKSPIRISKHPCHQTIRIISISYVMTFVQQYSILTKFLDRKGIGDLSTLSRGLATLRTTVCYVLANWSRLPCQAEKALAFVCPPRISLCLVVSPPLCCKCILHLTELLPSC